jgi:hypothetical protein
VIRELEHLLADAQRVPIRERDGRQRPVGIRRSLQQAQGLFVRDDDGLSPEALRATDVVDVSMAVDDVGDRLCR